MNLCTSGSSKPRAPSGQVSDDEVCLKPFPQQITHAVTEPDQRLSNVCYESHPNNVFPTKCYGSLNGGGDPSVFYSSAQHQEATQAYYSPMGETRQRSLEQSGFITSYAQTSHFKRQPQQEAGLSAIRQVRQFSIGSAVHGSNHLPTFAGHGNVVAPQQVSLRGPPQHGCVSPSSRVKMSPRTMQPINGNVIEIPPIPVDAVPLGQKGALEPGQTDSASNLSAGCSSHLQIGTVDVDDSHTETLLEPNYVLQADKFLSFEQIGGKQSGHQDKAGLTKKSKSKVKHVQSLSNSHLMRDSALSSPKMAAAENHFQQRRLTQQKVASKIVLRKSPKTLGKDMAEKRSRESLDSNPVLGIFTDQAGDESHMGGESTCSRVPSVRAQKEFLQKQLEFNQKKEQKILKAQLEKQAREEADFRKNFSFQPNLKTAKSISPRVAKGRQSGSPVRKAKGGSPKAQRTLQQFLNDQKTHMFKRNQKLEIQQSQKKLQEEKQITLKPQLNPTSKKICKRIKQELMEQLEDHNGFLRQSSQLNETDDMSHLSELVKYSNVPQAQQVAPIISTPVPMTKKKKSPTNLKTSTKDLLLQKKRLLAKQGPEQPTFVPKINSKSTQLVMRKQRKEQLKAYGDDELHEAITFGAQQLHQPALLTIPSDLTDQNMLIQSPIAEEEGAPMTENSSLTSQTLIPRPNKSRITKAMTPKNDQSRWSYEGFFHMARPKNGVRVPDSQNRNSRSPCASSPRIAEQRKLNEQRQKELEKQKRATQSKKHNENLILRNFKRDLNAVLAEYNLGQVPLKDKDEDELPLNRDLDSPAGNQGPGLTTHAAGFESGEHTVSTGQYHSALEYYTDDSVEVDLVLILHRLGFLQATHAPRDLTRELTGKFMVTLDDKDAKYAFKANLFSTLAAVQSINLRNHYPLYSSFGVLQGHILEDITQQIDEASQQLGLSHSNISSNKRDTASAKHAKTGQPSSTSPCSVSVLLEALGRIAAHPFPFQLNQSHMVKLHLTFMTLFLNRKDSLSVKYKDTLEQQEQKRYLFKPQINGTQGSVSPSQKRISLNKPQMAMDEIKMKQLEKMAKVSSIQAQKEKQSMKECTFKPKVNPKSTKIAYKLVSEMHLGQKEFQQTYMAAETSESDMRLSSEHTPLGDSSTQWQQQAQNVPTSRLSNRIQKLVSNYVNDMKLKKDITTEEKEFERSTKELKFKPNIATSQLSLQKAIQGMSPRSLKEIAHKSPTAIKRGSLMKKPIINPVKTVKLQTYSEKHKMQLLSKQKSSPKRISYKPQPLEAPDQSYSMSTSILPSRDQQPSQDRESSHQISIDVTINAFDQDQRQTETQEQAPETPIISVSNHGSMSMSVNVPQSKSDLNSGPSFHLVQPAEQQTDKLTAEFGEDEVEIARQQAQVPSIVELPAEATARQSYAEQVSEKQEAQDSRRVVSLPSLNEGSSHFTNLHILMPIQEESSHTPADTPMIDTKDMASIPQQSEKRDSFPNQTIPQSEQDGEEQKQYGSFPTSTMPRDARPSDAGLMGPFEQSAAYAIQNAQAQPMRCSESSGFMALLAPTRTSAVERISNETLNQAIANQSQSQVLLQSIKQGQHSDVCEWTEEFAKVVEDCITVDQTSIARTTTPTEPSALVQAEIMGLLKTGQSDTVRGSLEPQKMTPFDIQNVSAALHTVKPRKEKTNSALNINENDEEESSSQAVVVAAGQVEGMVEAQAAVQNSYRYVNDARSSSQGGESMMIQSDTDRHQFIDSTVQVNMIEERPSIEGQQQMPRLDHNPESEVYGEAVSRSIQNRLAEFERRQSYLPTDSSAEEIVQLNAVGQSQDGITRVISQQQISSSASGGFHTAHGGSLRSLHDPKKGTAQGVDFIYDSGAPSEVRLSNLNQEYLTTQMMLIEATPQISTKQKVKSLDHGDGSRALFERMSSSEIMQHDQSKSNSASNEEVVLGMAMDSDENAN